MITGGYYIKSRRIQESDISTAPPYIREIWDWLIQKMLFEDVKNLKRGQSLLTLQDIREGLKWYIGYRKCMYSKAQCENAMKWLRNRSMITTTKTTRGMLVTVCKYDYYQRPENYESNSENNIESHKRATVLPNDIDKNDKEDKELNNKPPTPLNALEKISETAEQLEVEPFVIPLNAKQERKNSGQKKEKPQLIEIILPWDEPEFINAWEEFKNYRREHPKVKDELTSRGEQSALTQLATLSNRWGQGDSKTAIEILKCVMANQWVGWLWVDERVFRNFQGTLNQKINGKFNREAADAAVRAVTGDSSFSGWTNSSVASGR